MKLLVFILLLHFSGTHGFGVVKKYKEIIGCKSINSGLILIKLKF